MRTIRTQGKRTIVIVDTITSIDTISPITLSAFGDNSKVIEKDVFRLIAYFQGEDHCVMGNYSTEERLITVLDLLEDWLCSENDTPSKFQIPCDDERLDESENKQQTQ